MGVEEIECVRNLEWWVWKDFEEYVSCDVIMNVVGSW